MIIKDLDEQAAELATIGRLLMCTPAGSTNHALETERDTILHALEHERDSTSKLDTYFDQSSEWALIHDLRLEMGEHKAHFQHLLIGRHLDIYVIDTSYYYCGLEIGPGGTVQCRHDCPIEQKMSPREFNRKKLRFLSEYLRNNGLLPKRMGVAIRPRFHSLLLVASETRLELAGSEQISNAAIVCADRLAEWFTSVAEPTGIAALARKAKQISVDELRAISNKLAQRHLPRSIDYVARYRSLQQDKKETGLCEHCQQPLDSQGVQKQGLGEYCYACQRDLLDMANYPA